MATIASAARTHNGLHVEGRPEPCVVVIFGATGDLTHRKLIPALYALAADGRLPEGAALVGFARRPVSDEEWQADVLDTSAQFGRIRPFRHDVARHLADDARYVQSSFEDPAGYEELKRVCEELDARHGTRGNRLFYLSTATSAYTTIVEQLAAADMIQKERATGIPWTHVIVEKPFGHDLESARALNAALSAALREDQIYRIDHYLGKETVQNIIAFRFSNRIFESLWNRDHIDNIQFTVAEKIGVEGRGPTYESTGALRDMVANHMLQLLALVAMEPPISLDADAIRDEKVKVLRAIPPLTQSEVARRTVRGQYGPGVVDGHPVAGYRQEERVDPSSLTETFTSLRLSIENWRWAGVPIYLRHGKRLPERWTAIIIQFKRVPRLLFGRVDPDAQLPNVLTLRVQPDDGISLRFVCKVPGPDLDLQQTEMDFGFSELGRPSAEAYERLLLDAMSGQQALFIRRDESEAAWAIVTSIMNGWANMPPPSFPNYPAGTWGPPAASVLLERRGYKWLEPQIPDPLAGVLPT
jgi:glucose-6-phosphate 1-dehydrogenase